MWQKIKNLLGINTRRCLFYYMYLTKDGMGYGCISQIFKRRLNRKFINDMEKHIEAMNNHTNVVIVAVKDISMDWRNNND